MPLALRDLQAAFAAHLSGEARPDLVAAVVDGTRLGIHRHNVVRSLCRALAATYPTVQALVGEGFFRGIADAFVAHTPPAQPVLGEYGVGFAEFVAACEPARSLPYLADMARLDWALNGAFYSPRGPRLTAAGLSAVSAERLAAMTLVLASGTALVRSPYPIDLIWAASQPGAPERKVDLDGAAARLLVLRRPDDASFIALGEGEASFVAAVVQGQTVERATEAGFAADAGFDLSRAFVRLLACEAFAALQQ